MSVRTFRTVRDVARRVDELEELEELADASRDLILTTTDGRLRNLELPVAVRDPDESMRRYMGHERPTAVLVDPAGDTGMYLVPLDELADLTVGASFRPRVLEHKRYAPHRHTLGRCRRCGGGYAWRSGTARLADLPCPGCAVPLQQTSSRLAVDRWSILDPATTREVARRQAAIARCRDDRRVAKGTHVRVRDLTVGDQVKATGGVGVVLHAYEQGDRARASTERRVVYLSRQRRRARGTDTVTSELTVSSIARHADDLVPRTGEPDPELAAVAADRYERTRWRLREVDRNGYMGSPRTRVEADTLRAALEELGGQVVDVGTVTDQEARL